MDEMKLKLSTRLMRGMVANILAKMISKKLGCDIQVLINEIDIKVEDGKMRIHADVDAEANSNDIMNIVKDLV